jgi:cysteine desulfurase/selenocysteine lyase
MNNIVEHEKQLRKYFMDKLASYDNVEVYNPHGDTGIIAFNVKGIFAQDAASYIGSQGIAVRSGNHCAKLLHNVIGVTETIRASFYFYNTFEDADRLLEALKTCTIENCIGIFF